VTRTIWRLTVLAALSLLAMPIALILARGQRSLIVRVELLVIAGCALGSLTELVRQAVPGPPPSPLDQRPRTRSRGQASPATLSAIDRRLKLATLFASDAHHWTKPLVRDIAADRLALRRGLEIDPVTPARIAEVQAILGPIAWALSRPAPLRPDDPLGPGIPMADVEEAVAGLERI
jgi:hypothetical protein